MTKQHDMYISPSELRNISVIEVSGNTFAAKDQIRAAGGTWDKARKVWTIRCSGSMSDRSRLAQLTFDLYRQGCRFASR